jgi:cell division protein FtsW
MKNKLFQPGKKFDPLLFYGVMSLSLIGLVMVLSSSSYLGSISYDDAFYFFKKQSVFFVIGLILMLIISKINYKTYNNQELILFVGSVIVIFLFLLFTPMGKTVNNATRWLEIGPIPRFSPSELAKLYLAFFYAWWINKNYKYFLTLKGFALSFVPMIVVFILIVNQPDLSTAGLIALATIATYFQAGARFMHIFSLISAGAISAGYFILSSEYRINRIIAVWKPFENQLDEGYQVVKSLYALGSGGLWGLGIGNSRQKYLHLPERHTDFIFSIMGEEIGYIGLLFVLFLFFVVFWRGYYTAIKADTVFGKLLALGITNILLIQTFINITVAAGLFPTTGMTLPFISYGGTSLVITMAATGVLLNISSNIDKNPKNN